MRRTLLAFCCSLVLVAFAGSALAADDLWPRACPADSKEECKKRGGYFDPWKKTCTIKYTREVKCKKDFKAVVKHTIKYKEEYGQCKKKEDKKIVACYNKKDKLVDVRKCEKNCFKKDDDKDDDDKDDDDKDDDDKDDDDKDDDDKDKDDKDY
jgi:hypothetical protein